MRRKRIVQDDSDDESDADSDTSGPSSSAAVVRRGRKPGAKNKRQRAQTDSDDDQSPQPSTSYDVNNDKSACGNSDSDSGSETPDSDYGPVERSLLQNKARKKVRGVKPQKAVSSSKNVQKPNQSNASKKQNSRLSQSVNNGTSFDSNEVESMAQKLVYFLLIDDQKKYAIRKKAIVAAVFKTAYCSKYYSAVISKANSILKKTYGMELMQLENQKDSYMVVNVLNRQLGVNEFVELSRLKQQQQGLILYILTLIFMNENVITEDELRKSLEPLGIDFMAKKLHPVFGDVKKYITVELVKQLYLQYECVSKDPPKYEFTWGLRAKQELDKKDLLQFSCQIMDDTSPEDWKIQYKDAEHSAKPDANR